MDEKYEEEGLTTIGMDLKSITLQIDDVAVRLQIWDTAGQEQFSALTKQYFRGCQGAIAVFDLTQPETLMSLNGQLENFKNNCPPQAQSNIILVGSKCDDTQHRKVAKEEAQALCDQLGCLVYYETSARENINIDQVFYAVASKAHEVE